MPVEPSAGECCGRGCENCVYVYYEKAMRRWQDKVTIILSEHGIEYFPPREEE